jgi:hypothetical protein
MSMATALPAQNERMLTRFEACKLINALGYPPLGYSGRKRIRKEAHGEAFGTRKASGAVP